MTAAAEHGELIRPIVEHNMVDETYEMTMPFGTHFYISKIHSGAFVGDWQIRGAGFYRDGFASPDAAIRWLETREW